MTLAIISLFAAIPITALIASRYEMRRMQRSYREEMSRIHRETDIEFNRMYNNWLKSKAAHSC